MPDLNALLVFAKVAEANGFSPAAQRLGMPVSTVSRKIADLEKALGVRLLERSTRNVRLTNIGAEVLLQAQRLIELSDSIGDLVSDRIGAVRGNLRISAPPSISDTLLVPLLNAFQAAYPEVRVNVLITDRLVDHISEGVDVAFRVGRLHNSTLVARTLLRYRHRLVASPAYLAEHGHPQSPADLLSHRLLAFSFWGQDHSWTFLGDGRSETVTFAPHLAMNDYQGLGSALVSGRGIGDLPPIVAPEWLANGDLVEILPGWTFRPLELSLVHVSNRNMPRPVRLFKELAVDMAPQLFPALPG